MPMPRKPRSISNCRACGKEIEYLPSQQKGYYCSWYCFHQGRYDKYIVRWKAGLESGKKGTKQIAGPVRRYMFEKYGKKCSQCGWAERNPVTGNVPVEIDHIDGDKDNNTEEDLRILCPNCHSLTPTFRALNIGNTGV